MKVWHFFGKKGRICADTDFKDEDDVWSCLLGGAQPGGAQEEIDRAKARGDRVLQVDIVDPAVAPGLGMLPHYFGKKVGMLAHYTAPGATVALCGESPATAQARKKEEIFTNVPALVSCLTCRLEMKANITRGSYGDQSGS